MVNVAVSLNKHFMRQIREFRSNFENISRDYRDIRESVSRRSHECSFIFSTTVATLVRMSLISFISSPDGREVFACFLKTVARPSYDIHTSVAKISHCKFAKISRRQVRDTRTNVQSDRGFGNQLATISRHMKILTTIARHSHECRAKVRD